MKRRREPSRGEDGFIQGNIIAIEMQNFMTYTHIVSRPSPRLNLVIGPNGTGKSSLVCAIAIGLGGEPQLLGRAGSIGDYVKRGEESGCIRISLRGVNDGETIVITRKIYKSNKSEWLMNGMPSTKKNVQEIVRRINIQVNNLTQFLPQDRVCEFAKLSPVQLLEETEKAVGDPELAEQHHTLIRRSIELKQHKVSFNQLETQLNQHKANNAELEKDVERVQERNRLYERVEQLNKKLPWLKYDRDRKTYTDAKLAERNKKNVYEDMLDKILEAKKPLETKKRKRESLENACKKLRTDISRNEQKRRDLGQSESEKSSEVKAKMVEIESIHRREAGRQQKIQKAMQDVADAELELAKLPSADPPKEEIDQLLGQIHQLESAAQDKTRVIQDKMNVENQKRIQIQHCSRRLEEIQSVTNRRLQILKDSGTQRIFEAYQWVEQRRSELNRDVYGPILLEVNIPNKELAAYVEGHVAYYIWKAFITQDGEDRDTLVRNLKQYDVPVINFIGEEQPPGPALTREMEGLGITSRLDQVISAPAVVKNVLIGQFALNHSFIGSSETNRKADRVKELGVRDLWTPENHYRWQASRYGGPISASVNTVRPARLFSESINTREHDELEQRKAEAEHALSRVKDEIRALQNEKRQLEDEASLLHKRREDIVNEVKSKKKRQQDVKQKIEQRKRRLVSFENEEDTTTAENRLRSAVGILNEQRCEIALKLQDLLIEAANNQMNYTVQSLTVAELEFRIKVMEKEYKAQEVVSRQALQEYDSAKERTQECRIRLQAAKDAAEAVAVITPQLTELFAEMPGTVEDLEDAIEDSTAQARAVLCPNPNVLQEYERRCKQISELTSKLESEKSDLESCTEEIEQTKSVWLTTLRTLVTKINETFSHNFKEMAVAGEVSLDERDTDFDKYGILIKVKFRENGELQVLSASHQSGGERSVSTILYLVSLQDLTHCPFRVVDEINQGMDPINERKMFQQLVRAASQPNTPQCFLLTPKLLPDLEYSEACTTLQIMNGPWIGPATKAWKDGSSWTQMMSSRKRQATTTSSSC